MSAAAPKLNTNAFSAFKPGMGSSFEPSADLKNFSQSPSSVSVSLFQWTRATSVQSESAAQQDEKKIKANVLLRLGNKKRVITAAAAAAAAGVCSGFDLCFLNN